MYGVTSTYNEYRRFRISAASAKEVQVQLDTNVRFLQGVSDNFDSPLSTHNGMKQTYSLATILVQNGDVLKRRMPIPRLTRSEMKDILLTDAEIKIFQGEKTPLMSESHTKAGVFQLKVLCRMAI